MHLYLVNSANDDDGMDRLLNQLGRLRSGADDDVDDGDLATWARAQTTDPEAADPTVTDQLLRSAAARELLVDRAASAPSEASLAAAQHAWPASSAPAAAPTERSPWWGRMRWWALAAATATVTAAGVLIVPRVLDSGPEVPPYALELRGGVADVRGVEVVDGHRFVATSQVTLVLRPQAALGERPPVPQVFVANASGALQAAPEGTLKEGQGGVWRFRARGDALFQGPSGPRVLHVVFAYQPVEVEGLRADEARDRHPSAGWYAIDVTWDAEGDR